MSGGSAKKTADTEAIETVRHQAAATLARIGLTPMALQFAPDGTVLGEWGERGDEPGEFRTPWGIALDGQGAVYISDPFGKRIQKFRLLPPLGPDTPSA